MVATLVGHTLCAGPNKKVSSSSQVGVAPVTPSRHVSSVVLVSDKAERRAARSVVAQYHQVELDALVAHVAEAIDRHRAGELDAFDVDRVLFQYSRAAKELWKFCNYSQVEIAATMISEQPPHDWWERGASRER
jgi:hypothetical protein